MALKKLIFCSRILLGAQESDFPLKNSSFRSRKRFLRLRMQFLCSKLSQQQLNDMKPIGELIEIPVK
ncbi:hypothetical protein NSQ43_03315 [Sporosarcina sp. FSL W8-0480]|uniref:hypothetical protein n=1 Tax=Sporosarcina sp. FSL W8-0480 TaxID=2954701 RepID=UPI0030DBC8B9